MKNILIVLGIFLAIFAVTSISAPHAYADCIPFQSSPNLYQVDRVSSSSATLYFTPLNDDIQHYEIDYGFSVDDRRYSVIFNPGTSKGAVSYTVNGLDPAFTYYYSVSATNSCSGSPWSNWVSDAVESSTAAITPTPSSSGVPVAGSETLILAGIASSLLMAAGLVLYKRAGNYTSGA